MFDPSCYDLLPFSLGKRSSREIIQDLVSFIASFKEEDISFNVSDDTAMIALGCGEDPKTFRENMMRAFTLGEIEKVGVMVRKFNDNTKCKISV